MTNYHYPPAADERLSRAANTSDLTVAPDRKGDAYTLIAAGKTPRVVGRHLIALYGEWDMAAPRRLKEHDYKAVEGMLPFIPNETKEERRRRARAILQAEYQRALRQSFERLKSLPKASAGLVDMLGNRITDPEPKVMAMLAWWLHNICPVCNGTCWQLVAGAAKAVQSNVPCRTCRGSGKTPRPGGLDEMLIESTIERCVARARQDIRSVRKDILRQMR